MGRLRERPERWQWVNLQAGRDLEERLHHGSSPPHPASHLTTTASIPLWASNFPRNQDMKTHGRPDHHPHFANVKAPGEAENDLPKATEVAETESDQKLGFYLRKAPVLGHSPLCHPVEPALWPGYPSRARQPRGFGPGQDKAKRVGPDGSRISPGSGAQPLRPVWQRRQRQVPAWRWGWASGRMLTGRPCLTRAERTKRSGPVCARGSSRGGSGGPGAWLWPLVIRSWSSASERRAALHSASRRLACAPLLLTRRRPGRPPQVRTWPAPPSPAALHPLGPFGQVPSAHLRAVPKPGLGALLYGLFSPRP